MQEIISRLRTYIYKVYGVIIESEIELPELIPAPNQMPEVRIRIGNVPPHLPEVKGSGVLYEAYPNDFLFRLDTVAAYRIRNGNEIIVESKNAAAPEEVRLFLLGSAIGALIHQRGSIPIHGSSIVINDSALIIAGASASGKSTLAAGLSEKGYKILADDISVVALDKEGIFKVYPGIPHLKLWKDVTEHLDFKSHYEKVRPTLEKYKIPLNNTSSFNEYEVKDIVVLSTKNSEGFTFERKSGIEKFNLLRENTYRYQFLEGMGLTETHFKNISTLANRVNITRIERPSSPLLINELIAFLENNVIKSS